MIQRIQSVYFLLLAIVALATLFSPIFSISTENASFSFTGMGLKIVVNQSMLLLGLILLAVTAVLSLIVIFLFKNRKLQAGIATLNYLPILSFIGLIAFRYSQIDPSAEITPQFGIGFPVLMIVLNFMAIRSINKDEKLVRSMDRLR